MSSHEKPSGFIFQKIPLQEAVLLAQSAGGIYSELKETLMRELPKLDVTSLKSGETLSFNLSKKDTLTLSQSKNMQANLTYFLQKMNIPWKIVFNTKHHLFVCVPRVFLGLPPGTKKYAARSKQVVGIAESARSRPRLEALLDVAAKVLEVPRKRLTEPSEGSRNPEKKAVMWAAMNFLGLRTKEVDQAFGLTNSTSILHKNQRTFAKEYLKLSQALKGTHL